MADLIHQPHDKLFRSIFAEPAETASLLRAYLPASLSQALAWSTLSLVNGSFIDEALRESESDLLFEIEHVSSGTRAFVYVLLEHQSSADRWMRFRLLRYCCRIWERSFREQPAQTELRPIVPLVFYQGRSGWQHATEFADLFPAVARSWPFVPRFAHLLIDQSALEPEAVQGGLKGRIVQLLLLAAFHAPLARALEQAVQLMATLPPRGGLNEVRLFIAYVMATQEPEAIDIFSEAMQRYAPEMGGEIMTYEQQLLEEGRMEGRMEGREEGRQQGREEGEQKGKLETIESFLRAGVAWPVIEAATGMNEQQFQALKQRLQDTMP